MLNRKLSPLHLNQSLNYIVITAGIWIIYILETLLVSLKCLLMYECLDFLEFLDNISQIQLLLLEIQNGTVLFFMKWRSSRESCGETLRSIWELDQCLPPCSVSGNFNDLGHMLCLFSCFLFNILCLWLVNRIFEQDVNETKRRRKNRVRNHEAIKFAKCLQFLKWYQNIVRTLMKLALFCKIIF